VTFNTNMSMNFNVFHAAARCGLKRVVWASSETTLGLAFSNEEGSRPDTRPSMNSTTQYQRLRTHCRRSRANHRKHIAQWSGIPFVALRFSNIMDPEDYREFHRVGGPPRTPVELVGLRRRPRCRQRLSPFSHGAIRAIADSPGLIIAAGDTVMNRPSVALFQEVFPGVPITRDIGEFETLLAIDRAHELIGYEPRHTWRDHIES